MRAAKLFGLIIVGLDLAVVIPPITNGQPGGGFGGRKGGGGFSMQMFMLCQRYEQHRLAVEMAWGPQGQVVIQDRPIYGDTVFATTAVERGFMTREGFELYVDVFRNMSRDVMPPDIFVYLDVSPEECHSRMTSRAREQETGVPLDYLELTGAAGVCRFWPVGTPSSTG